MSTRPRLVRSIPFWGLVVVSLATAAAGALLLVDKLGAMTTALEAGTATTVDVYVGQSVAIVGAVVLGAGIVGILLALGIAAASTLRANAPVEIVEPVADELELDAEISPEHGYEHGLGYTSAIDTAAPAEAPEAPADKADEVPTAAR